MCCAVCTHMHNIRQEFFEEECEAPKKKRVCERKSAKDWNRNNISRSGGRASEWMTKYTPKTVRWSRMSEVWSVSTRKTQNEWSSNSNKFFRLTGSLKRRREKRPNKWCMFVCYAMPLPLPLIVCCLCLLARSLVHFFLYFFWHRVILFYSLNMTAWMTKKNTQWHFKWYSLSCSVSVKSAAATKRGEAIERKKKAAAAATKSPYIGRRLCVISYVYVYNAYYSNVYFVSTPKCLGSFFFLSFYGFCCWPTSTKISI